MDEGHQALPIFHLQYDGRMFIGLYDGSSIMTGMELFPADMAVTWPCTVHVARRLWNSQEQLYWFL